MYKFWHNLRNVDGHKSLNQTSKSVKYNIYGSLRGAYERTCKQIDECTDKSKSICLPPCGSLKSFVKKWVYVQWFERGFTKLCSVIRNALFFICRMPIQKYLLLRWDNFTSSFVFYCFFTQIWLYCSFQISLSNTFGW